MHVSFKGLSPDVEAAVKEEVQFIVHGGGLLVFSLFFQSPLRFLLTIHQVSATFTSEVKAPCDPEQESSLAGSLVLSEAKEQAGMFSAYPT